MFTQISGVYNNGNIILDEQPSLSKPVKVVVTFMEEEEVIVKKKKPLVFGFGKGTVTFMSPDFNEPLEDLKDYM